MTTSAVMVGATVRRVDEYPRTRAHRISASTDETPHGMVAFWTTLRPPTEGQRISVRIEWEES